MNITELLTNYSAVLACGGSWLTPAEEIAAGDYDAISKLAADAVAIVLITNAAFIGDEYNWRTVECLKICPIGSKQP